MILFQILPRSLARRYRKTVQLRRLGRLDLGRRRPGGHPLRGSGRRVPLHLVHFHGRLDFDALLKMLFSLPVRRGVVLFLSGSDPVRVLGEDPWLDSGDPKLRRKPKERERERE